MRACRARTTGGHAVRLVLATLLIAIAPLLAPPGGPRPAVAAEPTLVRVDLDQVTPTVAKPTDTITVTGRVTNITAAPLFNIQVLMWRNQAPYTESEQLAAVLASAPDEPFGATMINPGNFLDLTRSVASPGLPVSLDPGATLSFTVTGTVAQLRVPQFDAVYLVGAVVKGTTTRTGNPVTIGRGRSLLPVVNEKSTLVTPLTTIVELRSTPSRIAAREFLDDHLAAEVAAGGRLRVLLAAAAEADVSWAVDPELVSALEEMAAGYQVRTATGLVPGSGAVDAASWLAEFDRLDEARGHQLPYAHPDVLALTAAGNTTVLAGAERAATAVRRTADLPTLATSEAGLADDATVRALLALDPAIVLLSDASTNTSTVTRSGATPVVSFAADAFAGGPGPEPGTALKVRQQMVATGLLQARSGAPVVRLVTNEREHAADAAARAPYLRRTTLAALAAGPGAPQLGTVTVPRTVSPGPLTSPQISDVAALGRNYAAYAELLVNPGDISDRADAALARSTSGSWRGQAEDQAGFVTPQQNEVGGILSGESVTLGRAVPAILTGATGSFPLTVTNNLTVPVKVRVEVTSTNRSRLKVHSVEQVVVQPGERVQVQVAAEPATNGEVAVVAQLTTLSGTALGQPTTRTVIVTQYGTVGWAIAIAAGIAFFGGASWRIRQVRRERARAEARQPDVLTSSVPAAELTATSLPLPEQGREGRSREVLEGTVQTERDSPPEGSG